MGREGGVGGGGGGGGGRGGGVDTDGGRSQLHGVLATTYWNHFRQPSRERQQKIITSRNVHVPRVNYIHKHGEGGPRTIAM